MELLEIERFCLLVGVWTVVCIVTRLLTSKAYDTTGAVSIGIATAAAAGVSGKAVVVCAAPSATASTSVVAVAPGSALACISAPSIVLSTVVGSNLVHTWKVDLHILSKVCVAKNADRRLATKMRRNVTSLPFE